MKRLLDLSQVPTAELREIRNVLKFGAKGYASRAGDEARRLAAENAELRKKDTRRVVLADIGIDIDDDENYWLSLNDSLFDFVVKKCSGIKKETAIAERTQSVKIPPIISARELNTIDTIRQAFNEIKDRRNGNKELN